MKLSCEHRSRHPLAEGGAVGAAVLVDVASGKRGVDVVFHGLCQSRLPRVWPSALSSVWDDAALPRWDFVPALCSGHVGRVLHHSPE